MVSSLLVTCSKQREKGVRGCSFLCGVYAYLFSAEKV